MKRQTIKKGRHFTRFRQRYWWIYRNVDERCIVKLDNNCDYLYRTTDGDIHPDQYDWNKLEGMAFNLSNPHDRTLMTGWRWDPFEKEIEINQYYHGVTESLLDYDKIGNGAWASKTLLRIKKNEKLYVDRVFEGNDKVRIILQREHSDEIVTDIVKIDIGDKYHRRINNYFGGQLFAQKTFSAYKQHIKIHT